MNRHSRHRATDAGLVILAAIWGVNFSVVKVVLEELDPLALNALRFVLAAGALWLLVRRLPGPRRPERRDVGLLVFLGILGNVVYQGCFIFGIDSTLAGNASLLLATTPVWTVILSSVLGHERPTLWVSLGAVGTVTGMVLVVLGRGDAVSVGGATLKGDLLMIAAAVLWASYTVGSQPLVVRYGAVRVTAWSLWIGTPLLVVWGLPSLLRTDLGSVSALAWAGVVYAGVLSIGLAYLLWYRGVRVMGTSRTAVYSNLVPVAALITAWLWLGEVPRGLQLLGAAVILGGITLARRGGPYSPDPSSGR
jgi:drug/metabolite transporter (DMT)-like permease